jgi:hypothetical protein
LQLQPSASTLAGIEKIDSAIMTKAEKINKGEKTFFIIFIVIYYIFIIVYLAKIKKGRT